MNQHYANNLPQELHIPAGAKVYTDLERLHNQGEISTRQIRVVDYVPNKKRGGLGGKCTVPYRASPAQPSRSDSLTDFQNPQPARAIRANDIYIRRAKDSNKNNKSYKYILVKELQPPVRAKRAIDISYRKSLRLQ